MFRASLNILNDGALDNKSEIFKDHYLPLFLSDFGLICIQLHDFSSSFISATLLANVAFPMKERNFHHSYPHNGPCKRKSQEIVFTLFPKQNINCQHD